MSKITNLSFDEGYKEFSVNGDESRIVRFRVTDLNLWDRIAKLQDSLTEKAEKYKKLLKTTKNAKETAEQLAALDKEAKAEIDKAYDAPVSAPAFGAGHCLTPTNGSFIAINFIESTAPFIEKAYNSETKKINKYVKAAEKFK